MTTRVNNVSAIIAVLNGDPLPAELERCGGCGHDHDRHHLGPTGSFCLNNECHCDGYRTHRPTDFPDADPAIPDLLGKLSYALDSIAHFIENETPRLAVEYVEQAQAIRTELSRLIHRKGK